MATEQTWQRYVRTWKVGDPDERRALFEQCLAPECQYSDPLAETRGWEQLMGYMDQFHAQVPGGHFVTNRFRSHHGSSVAEWDMVDGDGNVIGNGISYGRYGDDGKLVQMTGFFDVPG